VPSKQLLLPVTELLSLSLCAGQGETNECLKKRVRDKH
jgi:hypothetical protein